MIGFAKRYHDLGYHVLLPNARAHGLSEGTVRGMGWLERKDMLLWIDQIVSGDANARIALHGVSMGGATVMMTAGEALPANVRAMVEDCGYTSAYAEFTAQLRDMFGLPEFPFMQAASLVTRIRGGYWLSEANAVRQVRKSAVPMLFIHGDQDAFVPFSMLEEVYQAATCEKEKLVVQGAGHGAAALVDPEGYWFAVQSFLKKHL